MQYRKYGTLTLNKVQKGIILALQLRNGIRWRELKRIIVDEKEICSERIFRENLSELVDGEIVFKYEITPQHIEYYLQKKLENIEESFDEAFARHYSQFQYVIQSIEKNKNKLNLTDLGGLIFTIWRMINNLEFLYLIVTKIHGKTKLLKGKDFTEQKIKLLNLISTSKIDDNSIRLVDFMERLARWEVIQFSELVKKELDEKQIPWFESKKPS